MMSQSGGAAVLPQQQFLVKIQNESFSKYFCIQFLGPQATSEKHIEYPSEQK